MNTQILVLPGWKNSGELHWQSLWQASNPDWRRIPQNEWDFPKHQDWQDEIEKQVNACTSPPVIVAHSLGCIAVANWSRDSQSKLAAAFLVAPPNLERTSAPEELKNFMPVNKSRLRFPALVVASENDPYMEFHRAQAVAAEWGAEFHGIGLRGHINAESDLQDWRAGQSLLRDFLQRKGIGQN